MAYRNWEVALGAVVLIVAVAFAAFAVQTTGTRLGAHSGYELTASFRSAEGVRTGTEVRIGGVPVGTVSDMSLDPDSFRAAVTVLIEDRIVLPEDSTIQVATEGLLGGTFVEILPGGSPYNLEPGAMFQDTQSAVSLVQMMLRFVTGSEDE
ncbi:MAG: outer membrane lipid asymmetry maintenance protein MlaD [Rhodobacteraceae bacterium HLUCCA12]|nr:MAG: outer membrane lipid asymmetry maintenance protein MlaD [Rhodobacteraceae bacterium HLUCCA12]